MSDTVDDTVTAAETAENEAAEVEETDADDEGDE